MHLETIFVHHYMYVPLKLVANELGTEYFKLINMHLLILRRFDFIQVNLLYVYWSSTIVLFHTKLAIQHLINSHHIIYT